MLSAGSLAIHQIEKHEEPAPPQLLQLEGRIVPTNFPVTSLADTATGGTLREAIGLANTTAGDDTIDFASSLFSGGAGTITLLTAQLPQILSASGTVGAGTRGTLTITGPGASTLTISGDNGVSGRDFRIFDIASGGNLSISGVTVTGANTSGIGGAFNNSGSLTVSNSTISGNFALGGSGGGIFNNVDATLTVTNSTISGNTANIGGGIYNRTNYGTLNIANTIIANSNTGGDYAGGGTVNLISGATAVNNIVTLGSFSWASDLACAWGKSTDTPCCNKGAVTMKIINNTSITSI